MNYRQWHGIFGGGGFLNDLFLRKYLTEKDQCSKHDSSELMLRFLKQIVV